MTSVDSPKGQRHDGNAGKAGQNGENEEQVPPQRQSGFGLFDYAVSQARCQAGRDSRDESSSDHFGHGWMARRNSDDRHRRCPDHDGRRQPAAMR
jgi:hypothetical protein